MPSLRLEDPDPSGSGAQPLLVPHLPDVTARFSPHGKYPGLSDSKGPGLHLTWADGLGQSG